jgi:hypothetical protein
MSSVGPRAIVAAVVPGVIVWAVFHFWLGLELWVAVAAGLAWALGSLIVTRLLYDDADAEIAAFRTAAPELAAVAALRLDAARDVSTATPVDDPR